MADDTNSDRGKCPRCGSGVWLQPKTRRMERCEKCGLLDSPLDGFFAGFFLVLILTTMGYLIYFCIKMLLE